MKSSSIFLNIVESWPRYFGLSHISEFLAALIFFAALLAALFILWLVLRKARLWYWRTNQQIDTLKSIDTRLHNVENRLRSGLAEADQIDGGEASKQTDDCKSQSAVNQEEELPESAGHIAVGKSGKVYTEAELELQIRD
jgi:hypothetical protein